jgi:hypothetical protein
MPVTRSQSRLLLEKVNSNRPPTYEPEQVPPRTKDLARRDSTLASLAKAIVKDGVLHRRDSRYYLEILVPKDLEDHPMIARKVRIQTGRRNVRLN